MLFQKLGMIMNQQYCKNSVRIFWSLDNLENFDDLIETFMHSLVSTICFV